MSTTTIRISDELKARIAKVAKTAETTPHAFMLEALTEATARAEADAELRRLASQRWAGLKRTGLSVPWDDARAWLESRAAGQNPEKPSPRVPTGAS